MSKLWTYLAIKKAPTTAMVRVRSMKAPMKKTQRELDFFHAPIIAKINFYVKNWREKYGYLSIKK